MLKIRNLDAGYGRLKVVRRLSLHVNPSEIVAIIGANGAGKSTLLNTISGLIRPTGGQIMLEGSEVTSVAAEKRVFLGMAQVREGRHLFAPMTVMENLILGSYTQFQRKREKEIQEDLDYVLSIFPRLAERRTQLAGTLSGGEQQMLAMARALMSRPRLLMLDEPSMGLAPRLVREIFNIIIRLGSEGRTLLLVEQNASAALSIADRGYVLETGHIVLEGPAQELKSNPDVQRAYLGKEYKKINE
ncbi:MAG: branched-chain amino acid ABC transporter ATP-binding protein [Elusimicrobia bacterium RIFOXYB2_FULL_49_7]|nr:MAG: branched-chain amino acid ABC transporter ATP-binding protein [Elusimicrobia bacterium RIFOXYB2_FULL_49_7]